MTNNMRYDKLPELLVPWYQQNKRELPWRKDKEPYHIWISEIMLQQTRVEAVKGYYTRFLDQLPTIDKLASVEEEKLLKLWEGLGYYNRARNLQKAAKIIINENNGVFPSEYSEILALPGIGEYTAGAIASTCFEQPIPAVDGNVLRVITRITELYEDIGQLSTKKHIRSELETVYPEKNRGDFTQSLMELGAVICIPNGEPKCGLCPAAFLCLARERGTTAKLPVKTSKKARKIVEKTVFILQFHNRIAIHKRTESGVLSGMWQLPNVDEKLTAGEALAEIAKWGITAENLTREVIRKHIFTHIEWHMTAYYIQCREKTNDPFFWSSEEQLKEEFALPTAFKLFLDKNL